ncbi:hypothetical protein FQA39_LY08627 [Lamprigera yunnana]|nr:hypothetical protein FQA39_LY08627 [Lamprigera yunnana]
MWDEALRQCSKMLWENCINHTENLIKNWYEREKVLDVSAIQCQQPVVPIELGNLENKLNEIPGLKNLNNTSPSLEEIINLAQEKCKKNGREDSFTNLMVAYCRLFNFKFIELLQLAKDDIQQCLESNFNMTKIQLELEEKRKVGSMEEVFGKYCKKRFVIESCLKNLTNAIELCLEDVEKPSLRLLVNITQNFIDFGCFKDGDRIAMFLAEGGLECMKYKSQQLQECANATFRHRIPTKLSLATLPLLVINSDGCQDYVNLQSCVVKVLETCNDHTSANLVDAIFKYVRRSTPCKSYKSSSFALGNHKRFARSNGNPQELNALLQAYDKLKQRYEPHCLQNGGSKARNEFHDALGQIENCQNSVQKTFMHKIEDVRGFPYDYMCKDFRNGLRSCLSNFTSKMEACSSKAEKYVPKFGLEIYDSLFKYQCKDDAKALKLVLGEQDYCMKTILGSTDVCIGKTKHIRDSLTEAVVTKNELCGDLKVLKNCFIDMASQKCPGIGYTFSQELAILPLPFNVPNFDELATVENAFKEKCNKNGGDDAFKSLKIAATDSQAYFNKNFEISTIKKEIEEARKTGSMDEVFQKYCNKRPEYASYTNKVFNAVEACLTDVEKPIFKLGVNVTENIVSFLCEKDGDRLGMFIAEDGLVCLNQKGEGLQKCGVDTLGKKLPTTFNKIPTLAITKEQCDDYKAIQKCAVKVLEGCDNPTPANIIDALLNTIYRLVNCKNIH